MKHLGERLYTLIKHGVKSCGTFNPEEIFCFFVEDLYADEVKPVDEIANKFGINVSQLKIKK